MNKHPLYELAALLNLKVEIRQDPPVIEGAPTTTTINIIQPTCVYSDLEYSEDRALDRAFEVLKEKIYSGLIK